MTGINKYDPEYWKAAARVNHLRAERLSLEANDKDQRIAELESALQYLNKEIPTVIALLCDKFPHHRATIESVLEGNDE